ncbi:ABC transporter ATP-binding protein [Tsukamurella sp. 8F]|uniref:ABC transporter ATP-binding protein n=1 Tax=unclassified Tsukamurella TaxID=2633480 RepID=UPI0023B99327|nr:MULTISPECIES: ABC transporter ATP-binding protein [unclassified Tsukamurella]MDF0528606.1 ABC transporter ATP-binding protein [Tsukamurella sp. 8J]MDF0585568.1 ABC transporter ATP-binding protein [Tsukamurella sp. 8F]
MITTRTPQTASDRAAGPLALDLDDVTVGYRGIPAVRSLTLEIRSGERLVLTGPSGCGKSTVLRALAGLLPPQSGEVRADGEPVRSTSRDRAMVFQEDALLPWRTVRSNVVLALGLRGVPRERRRPDADRWLEEVGLDGYAGHLPRELSGGMRQRVQLARGLAGAPRAVFMDEPFGALDAQTRATMQALLLRTLDAHPATVVFVTHDVAEAVLLGHRVAVMGRRGEPMRALVDVPDDPAGRAAALAAVQAALTSSREEWTQ